MNSGRLHTPGVSVFHRPPTCLNKPSFFLRLRLGQEPPPAPQEDAYDGRSLAEVRSYLPPSYFAPPCSCVFLAITLETSRQSRKSRAMAQRRARTRSRPHITHTS